MLFEEFKVVFKFEVFKVFNRKHRIFSVSTIDEILELANKMHWSKLELLRERTWDLAIQAYKQGDHHTSDDLVDVAFLIEEQRMLGIFDDPKASPRLKRFAIKYIEKEKKLRKEEAHSFPASQDHTGAIMVRGGKIVSPRSWLLKK